MCRAGPLTRVGAFSFTVLGAEFKLEYEGLHMICFRCGRYGHKQDACSSQIRSEPPLETNSEKDTTTMAADTVGAKETQTARVDNLGNQIHADSAGTTENESVDFVFGLWMIAKKQGQRRAIPVKNPGNGGQFGGRSANDHVKNNGMQASGSRFEYLNDETTSMPRDLGGNQRRT